MTFYKACSKEELLRMIDNLLEKDVNDLKIERVHYHLFKIKTYYTGIGIQTYFIDNGWTENLKDVSNGNNN